jgi:O-antigen/teichoic acid export membrane protein
LRTTSEKIGAAMAWSMASRVSRIGLGILTSAIVVRGLGDHDYGVFSLLRSILMFVVLLAGIGTGQAILKFIPELRVARSPHAARRLVRGVFATHTMAWLAILAVATVGRDFVERVFHSEGVGIYVVVAVALACFEIVFTVATHVLNASYDAARLAVATLASHVVYAAALVLAFAQGWGITGVLAAAALGNAVACVVVWGRVRAALSFASSETSALPDVDSERAITRARVLRYSLPFAAIGVLNLVVWRQSETILLAYFRTPEETGYFDVAYRLPQMVLEFVPGTVWPLVMAGMSEAFARDRASLQRTVAKYYRMLFALCAPLCAAGVIAGGRFVEVLYGDAMRPAAVPTQIFFAIFTVSFLATPLSMALYVLEKTHVNLVVYAILAVINVGLDLALIPRYGVYGAIIPVALAILLQPVLYYHAARRYDAGLTIPGTFIFRCVAGAAPALVMVPILAAWDGASGLAAAAVAGMVAVVLGYRWARVMGNEELDLLARAPVPGASRLAAVLDARSAR